MAKKRKKKRLRVEIKLYVILFSLLASIILMMSLHKPSSKIVNAPIPLTTEKETIVVLDPGHGGYDPGSHFDTIYEKDISLTIANLLGEHLEKKGIKVLYTRSEDVALSAYEISDLQARIDIGTHAQADFFVSLHMNESPSQERSNGFEVFQSSTSEKSIFLAQQVSDYLEAVKYTQRRSILDGQGLHVINFNPIPSVLIEMGFMSDEEDRLFLASHEGQQKVAIAIGEAIITSIDHFAE